MSESTTRNGITVPSAYKHQLVGERVRLSETEKLGRIRDYIESQKGRVLKSEDFVKALDGLTTAPVFVADLVKKGRIKRKQIYTGKPGHSYQYEWVHGNVVPVLNPVTKKEENIEITGRTGYATAYELKRIQQWFLDFLDKETDGATVLAANKFRRFVINGGELETALADDESKE